jgi:drug/metabolite transporter (DMT)-like permease
MKSGVANLVMGWEIAYLVGPAAVFAVFSWNVGIKYLGAVNGVLFINLVPITAFAIGLAQGRSFTGIEVTGAALTVAALVASNLWARGLLPLQLPVKAPAQAAAKG